MNKQLTDYLRRTRSYTPNEWYILDFPSISVIREIYNTNFKFFLISLSLFIYLVIKKRIYSFHNQV